MTTDEKADQRRHRGAVHTKPPRGVLLDIDGTLLDSNEQHARAWVEALRDHDVLVAAPEIRRLIGQGGDKILPRVGVDEDSDRGHAMRRTALEPALLVMLGDTPYDVEAAARAGIRAVGVRCGGWSDAELGGAVATYEGPSELLALHDASPLGRARQDASARSLRHARG